MRKREVVYVSDHSTVVKAETISAVSYTHLDVYKRQIVEFSRSIVFGEDRLRAVSYTHLDVYKRQGLLILVKIG